MAAIRRYCPGTSPAVHAGFHLAVLGELGELAAGDLASLAEGLGTTVDLQSFGQPPNHHLPAVSAHDGVDSGKGRIVRLGEWRRLSVR